ncbi:MAG: SPOR domain-containing protein, partial [Rickettsiaceae bacterium]|nr:SPOR domain-containing protein [Rickettsiaceae bacterium]
PNTDKLVYENLKPGRIENSVSLMPEPEEPVIITKESEEENPDKIDDIIGNILSSSAQTDEKKEEQASIPAQEEEQNPQPLTSQEDVKTLKIIPVEENRSKKRKNSEKTEGEYYRIQLVSVRTKEDADKEWDRMKKLYPKQLGNLPHIVQKVNLQNKGIFYRLLAGKFQSLGTAKTTCKKISSISHCVIVSY